MAARREIRYLRLHQRVSCLCARDRLQILRLLLCCRVLRAVPEYEADDELEAGGILREKPRPQPRERLFAFHGLSERTTVQTSSLLLRFLFFLPLGQLDPTRPISLTLTTQTPPQLTAWSQFIAGVRLVIVPCGLILCASLVRFCIWCVPNLRSKDPWTVVLSESP